MNLAILIFTSPRQLPFWARSLVATALVALAWVGVGLLKRNGVYAPFLLLIPVVTLVSAALDRAAGLYAVLLSSVAVYVTLHPGQTPPRFEGSPLLASLLLFVLSVATAAILVEVAARRATRAAKSERRKDLLLREASHRIKNNLQTISSLLRIQRRAVEGDEARAALETALARIHVMAAVHARLIGTDERETLEMSEFLISLCADLRKSMVSERDIAFEIDAHPCILDCSRAAAVGFVINELVTNAVKYAFVDGRAGTIAVSFRPSGGDFELEVADDGAGVPSDAKPGLGQTLIHLFARQLEGRIETPTGPGTRHILRFPVADAAPAG